MIRITHLRDESQAKTRKLIPYWARLTKTSINCSSWTAGKGHEQARERLGVAVVRHVTSDDHSDKKGRSIARLEMPLRQNSCRKRTITSKDLRFQQAAYWFVPAVPTRMSYETA